ncbi:serine hydrolase domain-containing protein [Lacticaseibacillus brantae]|uniref:Serine-type D-Ala-D-Ala carboxypeptidase n=1 Tax=Lacticaseibacillus brantae DSM 23927 TaxID=1423727 RepID=A0A0R2B911_9LACO|nr:serine hydrolase domain-containing protein [Lacticaseibacillus brantae]KRM72067.1 serine-type D-Ala-D-Ala carboxypeptidase [Lacticaseibacillus brantae DSM 23927]
MARKILLFVVVFLGALSLGIGLSPAYTESRLIPITVNYSPGYAIKTYDRKGHGKDALIATNTHLYAWRLTTINGIPMYQIGSNEYIPQSLTQRGRVQAQKLTSAEDELVKATHFQGNVLLFDNYRISSVRSYGYANAAQKVKNAPNTLFAIASVEKTFTAVLIAQLIKQGKLSYSTSLAKFYPDIPYAEDITIRQLLDHQSGIEMDEVYPNEPLQGEQAAIDWTMHNLKSTDNHEYNYTNANYVLLAGIIRQLTNESYAQVLKARILTPLKMTQAYIYDDLPSKNVALAYQYQDKDNVPEPISQSLLSTLLGTGNLYMSITDLATFQMALDHQQLMSKADFNQLALPASDDATYAGGWFQSGNTRYVHGVYDDFVGGFDAVIQIDHTGNSGVILLANQSTDTDTTQLANDLYQLVN